MNREYAVNEVVLGALFSVWESNRANRYTERCKLRRTKLSFPTVVGIASSENLIEFKKSQRVPSKFSQLSIAASCIRNGLLVQFFLVCTSLEKNIHDT